MGQSAENWTQLHVSAGCPGSSLWGFSWSLAGLINPTLLRAGLTQFVLACEQKEQYRIVQTILPPHDGQPHPGTAAHWQSNKAHQGCFSSCTFSSTHIICNFPLSEFYFSSIKLNNGSLIGDREMCQPSINFSFLHGKGNLLWKSCVESASTQVTHILSLLFRKLNSLD